MTPSQSFRVPTQHLCWVFIPFSLHPVYPSKIGVRAETPEVGSSDCLTSLVYLREGGDPRDPSAGSPGRPRSRYQSPGLPWFNSLPSVGLDFGSGTAEGGRSEEKGQGTDRGETRGITPVGEATQVHPRRTQLLKRPAVPGVREGDPTPEVWRPRTQNCSRPRSPETRGPGSDGRRFAHSDPLLRNPVGVSSSPLSRSTPVVPPVRPVPSWESPSPDLESEG